MHGHVYLVGLYIKVIIFKLTNSTIPRNVNFLRQLLKFRSIQEVLPRNASYCTQEVCIYFIYVIFKYTIYVCYICIYGLFISNLLMIVIYLYIIFMLMIYFFKDMLQTKQIFKEFPFGQGQMLAIEYIIRDKHKHLYLIFSNFKEL